MNLQLFCRVMSVALVFGAFGACGKDDDKKKTNQPETKKQDRPTPEKSKNGDPGNTSDGKGKDLPSTGSKTGNNGSPGKTTATKSSEFSSRFVKASKRMNSNGNIRAKAIYSIRISGLPGAMVTEAVVAPLDLECVFSKGVWTKSAIEEAKRDPLLGDDITDYVASGSIKEGDLRLSTSSSECSIFDFEKRATVIISVVGSNGEKHNIEM